ncbi:hypothetical protein M885DRAFT_524359 [Pelagophyceae sp. CCMP2097]|nr:hypothetical protein M885DRAFT_524359 [Pelagophyceae sp. CCMP2097]
MRRATLALLAWRGAAQAPHEAPQAAGDASDWESSDWASADGQSSDWGYTCSVPVALGAAELTFVDRPGDAYEARLERAETFAGAHGLEVGAGCASTACVAALLVEDVDGTICAQLLRAGVVFVPVGFTCLVAGVLRHNGARGAAFPFDWNISPLDAVNAAVSCALRADDAGTCAEEWFSQLRVISWTPSSGSIEDAQTLSVSHALDVPVPVPVSAVDGDADGDGTHVLFPHDFLDAADFADRASVVAKYARRFRRLARLLRCGGGPRVYLVHYAEPAHNVDWTRTMFDKVCVDGNAVVDAVAGARNRDVEALRSLVADRPHVSVVDMDAALEIAGVIVGRPG